MRESVTASGRDTVRVSVQALGSGLVRVVTSARSWAAGVRADANTLVLLRVLADTGAPSHPLKYRRIPGWWWAQIP